ncbi:MAG: STAS domain-containing protein [Deltaproteobacteria bacterium]|nr:MAG: STAS domain-containing protein [Deltaproteobacteria bacterium]
MKTLEITHRMDKKGVLFLKVAGFIDASNINFFDRELNSQMEKGYNKIILDCSELQYLNSSALGILLEAHQTAVKQQGGIRILNLPQKIEKTFNILGFNEYFQIFSDEAKAVQSLL